MSKERSRIDKEEDDLLNESLNIKKRSQPGSVQHKSGNKQSSLGRHYDPPTESKEKPSLPTSVHGISSVSQASPISTHTKVAAIGNPSSGLAGSSISAVGRVANHYNSADVPESALKSPTMLKAVFEEKEAVRKRAIRDLSPTLDLSLNMGHPDVVRNPFKFIETAIRDAKQKIQKMETP